MQLMEQPDSNSATAATSGMESIMKQLKARKRPKSFADLREMVRTNAEVFGEKTQYIYKRDGKEHTFSFARMYREMNALGTALCHLGLLGARVCVIGDSCPEYMATYYAVVNGGGVIVPLDRDLNDEALVNFINWSEAEAIVYTAPFNGRLTALAAQIPAIRYFVPIMEGETDKSEKVREYSALIAEGEAALQKGETTYLDVELDTEKMCTLLFTSGTTGTSKGVMLSQHNLTAAVNASCMSMEYDDTNRFVDLLPMHHSYEVTCGHMAIGNLGSEIYINDGLKNTMRSITGYKPNALMVVPLYVETMYKRIWAEIDRKGMRKKVEFALKLSQALMKVGIDVRDKLFGEIRAALGGELRSSVCGGAPISPRYIRDFYCFGIFVLEGYGITECSPLVAVNRPNHVRYHSVGQPVYGCTVKIDCAPGETTGEILVRGENVMLGYYKNPEATAEVFTEDGWFRTGDIGYMDKDNYIFVTGRKKNLIILSNGKNIFPEELEEHLSHSDLICESVIVGRKQESGEILITAIVYPEYEKLTGKSDEEVLAAIKAEVTAINRTLPVYKQIRDVEIRKTEFEKTTSKKVIRYKVK